MVLTVDAAHPGVTEEAWAASRRVVRLDPLAPPRPDRLVLVAPHPDDEVLGAAGLLMAMLADGVEVQVIAVTDGESSHPGSTLAATMDLADRRAAESLLALGRLGWASPSVTRLRLPDGGVADRADHLSRFVGDQMRSGDLWVAPWSGDGHPDHDACGRAVARSAEAAGVATLGYLVWAWHWADPSGTDIPWADCRRLDLTPRATARKRWATSAFRSQVRDLGPRAVDRAVLPPAVLRRFWRPYEVFVDAHGPAVPPR